MKKFISFLVLSICLFSPSLGTPAVYASSDWIDATHFFDKEVKLLHKTIKRESKSDFARRLGIEMSVEVKEYHVGDVETFWTRNIPTNGFEQTKATLKAIGTHCYLFLENGKTLDDSVIAKIVKSFDENIYPTDTSIFGQEWKPGIDGDDRITLLMMDIKDGFDGHGGYVAGYFFAGDEFLQSQIPAQYNIKSNEREMFYLDINPADPTKDNYMAVVAHEFQHMIHFHHDAKELVWVNEACSQIAPYYCGFGHASQISSFIQTPDNSMTQWNKDQIVANYGQVYLWNYYILGHFLKDADTRNSFFSKLVGDSAEGSDGYDNALKPFNTDFKTTFTNFAIANFVNDPKLDKGQYAYDSTLAKFHLPPVAQIKAFPGKVQDKVYLWSANGISVDLSTAKAAVHLAFSGNVVDAGGKPNEFSVAAVVSDSNGKVAPKISFMTLTPSADKKNISGNLDVARTGFDSMMIVVGGQAAKGLPNTAYDKVPQIPFVLDVTDTGSNVVAATKKKIPTRRLVQDYVTTAKVVQSPNRKISAVAMNNIESLVSDLGKGILQDLEDGSTTAVDEIITQGADAGNRVTLRPLAKKVAAQLEYWKVQNQSVPADLDAKIQTLRSY
ncbi:MAG: hypothetical protein HQM09_15695 [Candidatus Riflebacteria bacterium]|nr:hypothetical protein [Candidatus Riflebacteria bacterium]